jgi:hypothetical protein
MTQCMMLLPSTAAAALHPQVSPSPALAIFVITQLAALQHPSRQSGQSRRHASEAAALYSGAVDS